MWEAILISIPSFGVGVWFGAYIWSRDSAELINLRAKAAQLESILRGPKK